ncbi:MAG TPA: CocE/NonD family hydrolase [Candidatus Kapabacteria bacterium]|nr:CocE/NonD family hydrolase [Candidatus Kapabacteria bacterium]
MLRSYRFDIICRVAAFLVAIAPVGAQERYREVSIPTRDGQVLAADLYSSDTTVARPTILVQTPYNKNAYRIGVSIPPEAGGRPIPWDSAHYNLVVLDWRGFHGSRDAATSGYDRGLDGYDAVAWIAAQPWSNGRVGTWGPSALGLIQFQTARHAPPHLVCAVPLVKDFKTKYTDFYYGGEYRREHVESLGALGLASPALILSRPTNDAAWAIAERNSDVAEEINVPMLLIGGWYDHYPDDVMRAFADLRTSSSAAVRLRHKLLMGPWMHERVGRVDQGILSYPNAAGAADSLALMFFDRMLRELDNGYDALPAVRYYQMGTDEWRATNDWARLIAATTTTSLHLHPYGTLETTAPVAGTASTIRYDPRDPSPTFGGARLAPFTAGVVSGPQDQREVVESRTDALTFTTAPLERDLETVGDIAVELTVSSDREDSDIAIRLCDVLPDGRSVLLTQGIHRLRFRNGLTPRDTAAMTPGALERVTVQLQTMAMTWRAGHRLRIIVTSSNYPQYERNLNVSAPLYEGDDTLVATNRLYMGDGIVARVLLRVAGTSRIGDESAERDGVAGGRESSSVTIAGLAPIPARGAVPVELSVAATTHAAIDIVDMLGRVRIVLFDGTLESGPRSLRFDADELPAGAYALRVRTPQATVVRMFTR